MVLVAAGIVMCACAGNPMAALNSFAKGMGSSMISSACSSMGFALVMRFTGCDKHLINFLAKGLTKVHFLIIPGVVLATFAVNMALPSAAGTAAAAGAIFIPIMMGAGIHPAMAAAAVKCGTYGSMLNPGLAHNPFVAKIAGVGVMDVIAFHYKANLASLVIAAITITVIAYMTHENKDHFAEGLELEENFKVNYLYALMPIIPIAILLLGATKIVPMFKMGVAQAMVLGAIFTLLVSWCDPQKFSKEFFRGMGNGYGDVMGIIIAAGVFAAGLRSAGLIDAFVTALKASNELARWGGSLGPFVLAVITGSGDAATFAFNEAVTPHAVDFGMQVPNLGSLALISGSLGRTMSPIAGVVILLSGLAMVPPIQLVKRTAVPMIVAVITLALIMV